MKKYEYVLGNSIAELTEQINKKAQEGYKLCTVITFPSTVHGEYVDLLLYGGFMEKEEK